MLEKNKAHEAVNSAPSKTDLAKLCTSPRCRIEDSIAKIDAAGFYYRDLSLDLRHLVHAGIKKIELYNVCGQRYIGTSLKGDIEITISGTPGNDLGAFMDGPKIRVYGNAQDGCGNTMNSGEIIVNGSVGDIPGYAMRGGRVFIRGNVGYRAGIHMKEYGARIPSIVVGGTAGDFLAEYMAGGTIVLLGLNLEARQFHKSMHVGTGMHGGRLYVHGKIAGLASEAVLEELTSEDLSRLQQLVTDFSRHFRYDPAQILDREFYKICPGSGRPYGGHYAY